MSVQGKRALVGGASQGIGRACAEALAAAGASVTCLARDAAALGDAAASLATDAGQAHDVCSVDFDQLDAVSVAVAQLAAQHGGYDIVVNNTGGPASGPLLDATTEQIVTGISRHVLCFQRIVQAVVPNMKERGYGRIVNIISTSVLAPIMGLGVSNTTRGAVANWGRTLAGELAPFGITVNNVLPGFTATDRLFSLLKKKADRLGTTQAAIEEASKKQIPAGRFATANEIGAVVAFLASPAASYVNGVNLPVDGGRTAVQ